jgi:hypothetical protein
VDEFVPADRDADVGRSRTHSTEKEPGLQARAAVPVTWGAPHGNCSVTVRGHPEWARRSGPKTYSRSRCSRIPAGSLPPFRYGAPRRDRAVPATP